MYYKDKLKELRKNKNLKQYELAELLKLTPKSYSSYEIEHDILPISRLNYLCNYFNVSIDYMFNFTDIPCYNNSKADFDLKTISKRLKEFRKENNLTQETLAEILNVVKGTIGNYESARAIIATPFLYTICYKYHISADYILGKIDEPKYLK